MLLILKKLAQNGVVLCVRADFMKIGVCKNIDLWRIRYE